MDSETVVALVGLGPATGFSTSDMGAVPVLLIQRVMVQATSVRTVVRAKKEAVAQVRRQVGTWSVCSGFLRMVQMVLTGPMDQVVAVAELDQVETATVAEQHMEAVLAVAVAQGVALGLVVSLELAVVHPLLSFTTVLLHVMRFRYFSTMK
jgi:hypothetical protein